MNIIAKEFNFLFFHLQLESQFFSNNVQDKAYNILQSKLKK